MSINDNLSMLMARVSIFHFRPVRLVFVFADDMKGWYNLLEVWLHMQNANALVTMAIVSENANDPYFAFCEYIKYCLFTNAEDCMTIDAVRDAVGREFGVYLPINVLIKCLQSIAANGLITLFDHRVKRQGEYNANDYEARRNSFRETEEKLVNALISYVKTYCMEWEYDHARQQLINVLDRDGIAFDVFFHDGSIEQANSRVSDAEESNTEIPSIETPMFTEANLTGRFVSSILNGDNVMRDYLVKICEGLMICIGVYQVQSTTNPSAPMTINGTAFYFDTRLLLRYIGCANKAAVDATRETIHIVQERGGKIYYYPHTLEEMSRAFSDAISSLRNNCAPRDSEMRLYAASVKNNVTVLSAKSAGIREALAQDGIFMKPLGEFSEMDRIRFGFEMRELTQYMKESLKWDPVTIENDAASIWETHMNRRGNYQVYFGSADCLSVFVTSNSKLIRTLHEFKSAKPFIKQVQTWNNCRLPAITDMRLTCRLWTPEIDLQNISLLRLSANAVAAKQPTQKYINRVRDLARSLQEQVPAYSRISLPEFFDDQVTDAVIKATDAREENLDVCHFASSIAELAALNTEEQEKNTEQAEKERSELQDNYNKLADAIKSDAFERNRNKLGFPGTLLELANHWSLIVGVVFAGITAALWLALATAWPFVIIAVFVVFKIIESVFLSKVVTRTIVKKMYPRIVAKYKERIRNHLGQSEKPYEDIIVSKCISENKKLATCREFLKEPNGSLKQ